MIIKCKRRIDMKHKVNEFGEERKEYFMICSYVADL